MGSEPLSDDEIITAIRGFGSRAMTYVIANRLHRKWPTGKIRRHLEGMERRGIVERVPTGYAKQICWTIKIVPAAPPDERDTGAECAACGKPSEIGHYPNCMSAARPGWSPVPCQPIHAAVVCTSVKPVGRCGSPSYGRVARPNPPPPRSSL